MANSIIYSGGEGSWSNTIIYSGPITNANIIYNNKKWAKYNSINVPNNRVGGVQYKNKNINKWANSILNNLKNKWANINNNLLKIRAIYNLKNINKWANINTLYNKVGGPIYNIKLNNWTIKYIKGANGILNLINKWAIKYINNKIKWAIYNLKNINNKGIRIGPTHNIKLNNLINKKYGPITFKK